LFTFVKRDYFKKMNILVIGNISSIHDEKWITFLSKNCNHSFYITQEDQNISLNENQIKNYQNCGVKILPNLPAFSLIQFWKSIKGWIQVYRNVKKYNIDCVHVIFPTPNIFWVNFLKKPLIVSTRGSDVLVVVKNLIQNSTFKNKILLFLFDKNLKKSNFITCTSELQIKFLEENFNYTRDKLTVVRTGVDVDFVDNVKVTTKSKDQIRIFSPRFFVPIYNIETIIEAIDNLPVSIKSMVHLQLVEGKNLDVNYKNKILQQLSSVQFKYSIVQYFDKTKLIEEYKQSDLVVMVPHSDGTPNSALETMLCKKPLIMSDLNYQSPLFSKTCLLVNPSNVIELTKAIELSLVDYPTNLLDRGREMTVLYGNQKVEMQKIIDLYNTLSTK
jgi:glycosyltransferase involved in cell wall biosynthesis